MNKRNISCRSADASDSSKRFRRTHGIPHLMYREDESIVDVNGIASMWTPRPSKLIRVVEKEIHVRQLMFVGIRQPSLAVMIKNRRIDARDVGYKSCDFFPT